MAEAAQGEPDIRVRLATLEDVEVLVEFTFLNNYIQKFQDLQIKAPEAKNSQKCTRVGQRDEGWEEFKQTRYQEQVPHDRIL